MATCTQTFSIDSFSEKDLKRFASFKNEAKEVKLDFYQITQERDTDISKSVFEDLFSANISNINAGQKRIRKWLENDASIQSRMPLVAGGRDNTVLKQVMRMLAGDPETLSDLSEVDGKMTLTDLRLQNIIGMQAVLNNRSSATDLNNNLPKHAKGIALGRIETFREEEARLGTSVARIRLASNIGREYLKAIGASPTGKKDTKGAKGTISDGYMYQRDIGEAILQNLEKQKLIQSSMGFFPVGDIKTPDGDKMAKVDGLAHGQIVRINNDVFNGATGLQNESTNNKLHMGGRRMHHMMTDILNEVNILLTKQTKGIPSSEPKEFNYRPQKATINETMKRVVGDYLQQNSFKLGGASVEFFDTIHELWKKTAGVSEDGYTNVDMRHKSFMKQVKDNYGITNEAVLTKALGLILPSDYAAMNNSQHGENQSKTAPLISMMENWDSLGREEFYYSYFFAGNTRLFLNETTVQFQASKSMRALIRASEPTVYEGKNRDDFLNRLSVHSGLTVSEIENPKESTAFLNKMVKMHNEGKNIVLELAKNPEATMMSLTNNIMEQVDVIETIAEVRAGTSSTFSSSFLSESDASASGLIINMVQNIHNDEVNTMLTEMGLGQEGGEILMKDAYQFALSYIDSMVKNAGEDINNIEKGDAAEYTPQELSRLQKIKDSGVEQRELMKYLIMKFMYGQSNANNEKAFGETIAEYKIKIGQDPAKIIEAWNIFKPVDASELDLTEYTKNAKGNLDRKAVDKLTEELADMIAETTGKFLIDTVLEPVYAEKFKQTKDDIADLARFMSEVLPTNNKEGQAPGDSVGIMSPIHVMEALDKSKEADHNNRGLIIGLDKTFETMFKDPTNKGELLSSMRHTNLTSAQVIPVHSIDAAVLIRSIDQAYKELLLKEGILTKDDKGKLSKLDKASKDLKAFMKKNPMAPIHDAIYMPPMIAGLVEAKYEQNLMDVNYNYDIPTELLKEIDYRIENGGHTFSQRALADLDVIRKRVNDNFDKRRQIMDENYRNPDGKTWKTIPFSFAENLTKERMDGVETARKKREENFNAKKENPKAEPTPKTEEATTPDNDLVVNGKDLPADVKETLTEMVDHAEKGNLLTYDLETTGLPDNLDFTGITIVQIGYTNGKDINVDQYVKQDKSVLIDYLDKMEGVDSIKNSQVYKDIEAYINGDDKGAYSKAISLSRALANFNNAKKGKKVSGFNNAKYDDKVLNALKNNHVSDYDIRILSLGQSTNFELGTDAAGKLENASVDMNEQASHTALYDSKVTHEIMVQLQAGETVSFEPENTTGKPKYGPDTNESLIVGAGTTYGAKLTAEETSQLSKDNQDYLDSNPEVSIEEGNKYLWDTNRKITVDKADKKGSANYETYLAHEIMHDKTAKWLLENENDKDVKFLRKAIDKVLKDLNKNPKKVTEEDRLLLDRLGYGGKNITIENVAVLGAEKNVRDALLNKFSDKHKTILNRVLDKIKEFFGIDTEISAEKILGSVRNIENKGKKDSGKKVDQKEFGAKKQSETRVEDKGFAVPVPDTEIIDPLSKFITGRNDWLANELSSGFTKAAPIGKEAITALHESMYSNELYKTTFDTISKRMHDITTSSAYKRIKQYTIGDPKLKTILNQLSAEDMNSRKEMVQIMTRQTQALESQIEAAGFTDPKELEMMDTVVAQSGLFGIYENGMLYDIVEGTKSLDEAIKEIEASLGNSEDAKAIARRMSNLYLDKADKGTNFSNLEAAGIFRGDKKRKGYEALIALYSLKSTEGSVELLQKIHNSEGTLLHDMLRILEEVRALDNEIFELEHGEEGTKDIPVSRGNLMDEFSRYNYDIVPITKAEYKNKDFGDKGDWDILREPTNNEYGLAYRKSTERLQDGTGTINYIKTGVHISADLATKDSYKDGTYTVSKTGIEDSPLRYAIPLTAEEKKTLSYYKDPAKSLLRAYAHKQRLLATQPLRKVIIDNMKKDFIDEDTMNRDIVKLIDEGEHPIFIKTPDKWNFNAEEDNVFDQKIRDEYQLVEETLLSDVGGYNKRFTLVRKDVSGVLEGYREGKVFHNATANRALEIAKSIIKQGKTILIILNVPKIAMDFTAGMGLAMAKGASFMEAFKYGREAIAGSGRISKILNDRIQNDFELAMYKNKLNRTPSEENKYKNLQKKKVLLDNKLKDDPFSPAYYHGFMQSLGTDIISRDRDSAQGLQVEIEDLIKKMTIKDDGSFTAFNNAVKRFADLGGDKVNVSMIYNFLSSKLKGKNEDASGILKDMADDMNNIRSSKDMTKYLAELAAAPDSALVRFGGAMTVFADLMPRWTIYRHNINKGMSTQEAADDALEALPNYMFGMPKEVKFLSDLYITPFPSFYMRMQKTIFLLATKAPASFGTQLITADILNEMFGITGTTVASVNLFNKVDNGSLMSNPTELPFVPYSMMAGG